VIIWGIILSFFPDYANLWPSVSTYFRVGSFICYVLGVIVAFGDLNELTGSLLLKACYSAIGFLVVILILHYAAVQVESGIWQLVLKVLALIVLTLGAMVVMLMIPRTFAVPEQKESVGDVLLSGGLSNTSSASSPRGSRRESVVGFAIVIVSALAAVIELINSFLND